MMLYGASAFDQDLGWCVDGGVDLTSAFYDTQCASTYCGVFVSSPDAHGIMALGRMRSNLLEPKTYWKGSPRLLL